MLEEILIVCRAFTIIENFPFPLLSQEMKNMKKEKESIKPFLLFKSTESPPPGNYLHAAALWVLLSACSGNQAARRNKHFCARHNAYLVCLVGTATHSLPEVIQPFPLYLKYRGSARA